MIWEVGNGGGFVELSDARVQYDPPSTQTTLTLTNLLLNDTAQYRCRGMDGLANEMVTRSINVLPGM